MVNLFIVGAVKSGTTWLYNQLKNNDQIYCPELKEPQYFNESYRPRKHMKKITNIEDYNKRAESKELKKYVVDGSATYLTGEGCAEKIHRYNQKSKIIIMTREKVGRAFSHYLMNVREGVETRPVLEAITKGSDYVNFGNYEKGIGEYERLFKSSNILYLNFDDIGNPEKILKQVSDFLGLEIKQNGNSSEKINKAMLPKNKYIFYILANDNLRKLSVNYLPSGIKKIIKSKIYKENDKKLSSFERNEILKIIEDY